MAKKHSIEDTVLHCIAQYLADLDGEIEPPAMYQLIMEETEQAVIQAALQHNAFNQSQAAKWLGITRNTLKSKMIKHGIEWQ